MTHITRKYMRRLVSAIYAEQVSLGATPEQASAAAWAAWDRINNSRGTLLVRKKVELPWFIQARNH